MAVILEPDVMVTSYDVISLCCDLKENILGRIICPPSFVVIALISPELRRGGRISPPPPPPYPEDQKQPCLNRVNANYLCLVQFLIGSFCVLFLL